MAAKKTPRKKSTAKSGGKSLVKKATASASKVSRNTKKVARGAQNVGRMVSTVGRLVEAGGAAAEDLVVEVESRSRKGSRKSPMSAGRAKKKSPRKR
jgi:hypothetical protein